MTPHVVALHLHERHGTHPRPVSEVSARVGAGIDGDSHGNRERRAVLVLDRSTLEAHGLQFGDLREQITVEGLSDVTTLAPGTEIRVGRVTLQVTGECEPCTHIGEMNDQADVEAFRVSLQHRRGALCSVVAVEGPIRIGDPVSVLVRVSAMSPNGDRTSAVPQPGVRLASARVNDRRTTSAAAASEDEA